MVSLPLLEIRHNDCSFISKDSHWSENYGFGAVPQESTLSFFCHSCHSVSQYSLANLNLLGISSKKKNEQLKSEWILVEEFCTRNPMMRLPGRRNQDISADVVVSCSTLAPLGAKRMRWVWGPVFCRFFNWGLFLC